MNSFLKLSLIGLLTTFSFAQETKAPAKEKMEEKKEAKKEAPEVTVLMATSLGDIHIQLDSKSAPISVENFLKYVDDKFYDGTVFHRIINGFMIQGGGFTMDGDQLKKSETRAAIKNESENTPPNKTGTIGMARTAAPNTATSQFYINVVDNDGLNYPAHGGGYAVFGKVTQGMDVVNKIKAVKTGSKGGMKDVPNEPVIIKSVTRVKAP